MSKEKNNYEGNEKTNREKATIAVKSTGVQVLTTREREIIGLVKIVMKKVAKKVIRMIQQSS